MTIPPTIKCFMPSFATDSLRGLYTLLIGDMARVYRLLPSGLRVQVWGLFSGMLATAILEVLSISVLAFLGMSVASPQSTAQQPFLLYILNLFPEIRVFYNDPIRFVLFVAVSVFCIFMLKNILQGYLMWRVARLGELMSLHYGDIMLHRYLCSPYMWHISSNSSRTFQALSGRDNMSGMLIQLLNMYVYAITSVALFVTLLSATPGAIFGAIVSTAVVATIIYTALKRHVDSAGTTVLNSSRNQGKSLLDAMNGIREVLIYRQQKIFHGAYIQACREGSYARSFLSIAAPIPTWILETLGVGMIPLSIWIMAKRDGADLATVASVISLVMLTAWRILPMVNRVLSSLIAVRGLRPQTMASLEVFEEMSLQPTVELPDPDPDFKFDDQITFENICFRYPNAKQDALHDISFTVKKGSQIGFIGLSGAGKSTIVGIFSGLLEPTGGRIIIDGEPMNKERFAAYMLRVGYVPQAPYILAGTVADNVAFSHWGREYDREQVHKACRMAALELVETGRGIDTPVGERGVGLSGGQAQRVSIARALFCNPNVLILDESTSSLDQANEDAIMETINGYRGHITTIIVAHRLTTLLNCDYLYWLENGVLVDHGPTARMLELYRAHMAAKNAEK